jgi:hypothetical protein
MNDDELQKHFDDIFEELFIEMEAKYGEIEEMNICDNLSEHLAGNTYVKFRYEEDAENSGSNLATERSETIVLRFLKSALAVSSVV